MTVEAERLHRDVWPAEAFVPSVSDTPYRKARVFVTDQRVQVWADSPNGPVAVLDSPLLSEPPERTRGTLREQLHLTTEAGPVHVTRARGCGCHSPLTAVSGPVGWVS